MFDQLIKDLIYSLEIKEPENAICRPEEGEKKYL